MNKLIPSTGGIPSPHDYRDLYATAAAIAQAQTIVLPPRYIYDSSLFPVYMQDQEPACVSNSVARAMRAYWYRKTGKIVNFSPRFLDTLVKRFDGQDRATAGTFPRLVMKLACQYGCATTDTVTNDTKLPVLQYRDDKILTDAAFAEAAKYKMPGYIQAPLDTQGMRTTLFLFGPLSTLFEIGQELWMDEQGNITWDKAKIDPLRTPKTIESKHQMTVEGWKDRDINYLVNSWSPAWADKGGCGFSSSAWNPYILESWAFADIPKDVSQLLSNLPSPSNFHYQWNQNLSLGGAVSDDVKFLQIALMILGFLGPVPAADLGNYGPKTAAAVGAYQKANRIQPVPSSVGPQTRARLNAQFAV